MWFFTLLMGTCMLYSTRTTMPLLLPAVASELRWSKTESGTVLSSFFWGYTVTQVFQFSCFHLKFINFMRIWWSLLTFDIFDIFWIVNMQIQIMNKFGSWLIQMQLNSRSELWFWWAEMRFYRMIYLIRLNKEKCGTNEQIHFWNYEMCEWILLLLSKEWIFYWRWSVEIIILRVIQLQKIIY